MLERGAVSFKIVNVLGQTISDNSFELGRGRQQVALSMNELPEGYYSLIIQGQTQKIIRKLVVKK